VGQLQAPIAHCLPPLHALPQPPQFWESLDTSTHSGEAPGQRVMLAGAVAQVQLDAAQVPRPQA
jgi:hypothetical protein